MIQKYWVVLRVSIIRSIIMRFFTEYFLLAMPMGFERGGGN